MNINIWASKCSGQSWYIHYGSYAIAWSKNWTTIFAYVGCPNIGPAAAGPARLVPIALQHML